MQYYLAPMEGITTSIYRRIYHKYFTDFDKYFTPFFVPHDKRTLTVREKREILPELNQGMYVVPQILTNSADGFLQTADKIAEFGYREFNLNLGCPSRTVTGKGRGAGFLAVPDQLDRFLDRIYSDGRYTISIKTRLGMDDPEEFDYLLGIFNRYPVSELIIHPRTQRDGYAGPVHEEQYALAAGCCRMPVIYNGDLFHAGDAARVGREYPVSAGVMLGRGVIAYPGLLGEMKNGQSTGEHTIYQFLCDLMEAYRESGFDERQMLFKMKELITYMGWHYPHAQKTIKALKKAGSMTAFRERLKILLLSA